MVYVFEVYGCVCASRPISWGKVWTGLTVLSNSGSRCVCTVLVYADLQDAEEIRIAVWAFDSQPTRDVKFKIFSNSVLSYKESPHKTLILPCITWQRYLEEARKLYSGFLPLCTSSWAQSSTCWNGFPYLGGSLGQATSVECFISSKSVRHPSLLPSHRFSSSKRMPSNVSLGCT